jgi:hypothetical protein
VRKRLLEERHTVVQQAFCGGNAQREDTMGFWVMSRRKT